MRRAKVMRNRNVDLVQNSVVTLDTKSRYVSKNGLIAVGTDDGYKCKEDRLERASTKVEGRSVSREKGEAGIAGLE